MYLEMRKDSGIPTGITVKEYLKNMSLDSWQERIRYHRLLKGITASDIAKVMEMKSGTSYLKKYENACHKCYTSVDNYMKICKALDISYEDIADEYMLFMASDYDLKLKKAIEKTGLSSKEFAERYCLEYTTLRHSLKRMHKLSPETCQKYKVVFDELDI